MDGTTLQILSKCLRAPYRHLGLSVDLLRLLARTEGDDSTGFFVGELLLQNLLFLLDLEHTLIQPCRELCGREVQVQVQSLRILLHVAIDFFEWEHLYPLPPGLTQVLVIPEHPHVVLRRQYTAEVAFVELFLVAAADLEDAADRDTLIGELDDRNMCDVNETGGEDEVDFVLLL
jgi:hypothetical protein